MQIIIVDRRWARARTLNLSRWTLAIGAVATVSGLLMALALLYAVTFRVAAEFRVPVLHDIVAFIMRDDVERANRFTRDNVSAMARTLGQMQAQLLRLDALGERVSKVAGIRPEEFNFRDLPGQGGVLASDARAMSLGELRREIDRAAESIEQRADYMDVIESELISDTVRNALLPQNTPVSEGFIGSRFGMRTDPFTGHYAMHSGVDFAAPHGTPIFAAAGGVVVGAGEHPAYGQLIRIDHGNELHTLYAHASKILVKIGDLVKRGQMIGRVGSTGRSTGPHLHFEVRVDDRPKNPAKFLAGVKPDSPLASLAARAARQRQASARASKALDKRMGAAAKESGAELPEASSVKHDAPPSKEVEAKAGASTPAVATSEPAAVSLSVASSAQTP